MSIFTRFFARTPKAPPLAPLQHPTLGRLSWDDDGEGWIGRINYRESHVALYVGAGSPSEYPAEALVSLLVEPARNLDGLDAAARRAMTQDPPAHQLAGDAKLSSIETYQHYLADRTYTLVYQSSSVPDVLWRANFQGSEVESCGCDD